MTHFSRLFTVVLAGGVIGGCACPMHKESKAIDNEGAEVKVSIDQVPAAARATLERESQGAVMKNVDKETLDGKTVYEGDATVSGKPYEIVVAADGTLVSKKIDTEEAAGAKTQKKETDNKEEQGEHKD